MTWIEPLELETWILNVFSGSPTYFGALALFVISGLAAYFRMNTLLTVFMVGIFYFMFAAYIGTSFIILFSIIAGFAIGYTLNKIYE
jgi:ABC-type multidrug transport system permease subunit